MKSENRICQNCKNQFTIEPDDFSFYERIKVPPPTFCPGCRRQRRFAWRNERTLYRRQCDLCHENFIGLYPIKTKFPVYCHDCWLSDKWNPLDYGVAYDFSKPFFQQFKELGEKVPRLAIWIQQSVNSDYTNQSYSNKNVYLSFALRDSENVAYCGRAVELKQCLDSTYTHHSELLYRCIDTNKSFGSRFLKETENCVESGFLSNCRNCQNCFGGVNLRSTSYVFFGKQLGKEGYQERLQELNLGSRKVQENLRGKLEELKIESIFRFSNLTNTVHTTGDNLSNAKNCHHVFDGFELENARYSSWVFTSKEISDCYGMGGSEFVYEGIGVEEVNDVKFANVTDGSNDVQYTDICSASLNLFGCIGLRKKEYCILNKQYSKKDYEEMVPQIIKHMNKQPYLDEKERIYKYGEFFPAELSPFCYNETIAQEYFPLTGEKAEEQGFRWKEPDDRDYRITREPEDLPDNIGDVNDNILKETIGCEHKGRCYHQCATAFKIIPDELSFYRKMNIPLPKLCPNCRHYERLEERRPLKLWHRKCMCDYKTHGNTVKHAHHEEGPCPNEFETSYSPDRKEIVYCEQCYNAEVV